MTVHYPIVLEAEESGAVSAYVPGLPVYAAADTHKKAERAIRKVLTAYLETHPGRRSAAQVRVARFSDRPKLEVRIVGVAAMIGARRSATKARASRAKPYNISPAPLSPAARRQIQQLAHDLLQPSAVRLSDLPIAAGLALATGDETLREQIEVLAREPGAVAQLTGLGDGIAIARVQSSIQTKLDRFNR
ncbi:MAG TPA: type II toxin-antitoxin system HicB family antitoxin [Sphingomicrobium sp.]|nr:type II toxin-antitoxin system HicB family antitoxin [Sphingomicrobium sp.]